MAAQLSLITLFSHQRCHLSSFYWEGISHVFTMIQAAIVSLGLVVTEISEHLCYLARNIAAETLAGQA